MAMPKKERFERINIKQVMEMNNPVFPPESFIYNDSEKGKRIGLTLLGKSNKSDLFPPSIEETGIMYATTTGQIGQYIYTAHNGDLFDVLFYIDEVNNLVLLSIRTRLV